MTLFVDTQHGEGHSGDLAPLLRRYIVPASIVEESRMEFGDVAWAGNGPRGTALRIGVEVKTIGDVLSCIDDGRFGGLGGQLEGMHRDFDLSWLVIQDELRPDEETGVLMKRLRTVKRTVKRPGRQSKRRGGRTQRTGHRRASVSGRYVPALWGARRTFTYAALTKWVTSVQVMSIHQYGKPLFVWPVKTPDETAQWIVAQYRYWTEKPFEAHKSLHLFNTTIAKRNDDEVRRGRGGVGFISDARRRRMQFANLHDGVGYDRAMNLARRFDSEHAMAVASVEELTVAASAKGKRDGVGKVVAQRMWEQIREQRR